MRNQESAHPPVVDVHCHLLAVGPASGGFMSEKARRNVAIRTLFLWYGHRRGRDDEFDRRIARLLTRYLDESLTTDYAVALALDGVYGRNGHLDESRTHEYVPNDYVHRLVQGHEKLLFGPSVNPARADALDELDRVKELGAALVKWVPPSQDIDPADTRHLPFYRKLARLGLPLLSHTGYEHCVPVTDQMYGDPQRLRPALDEGVTVIAAHAGASGHFHPVEFFGGYIDMLDEYPNLYGDLSALANFSRFGYVRRMVKTPGFPERHMQATDYPVTPIPALFAGQLPPGEIVRLSRIRNFFDRDVETKLALGFPRSILYTAARILGMDTATKTAGDTTT